MGVKTCIVTGSSGYIGSRLVKKLESKGWSVTKFDILEGFDITKELLPLSVDVIFHMAALPRVEYSIKNPSETSYHNTYGTSRILEYAVTNKIPRVIFSSSSAAKDMASPYGVQKRQSELECKMYAEVYGLDVVCLRYFNVYSEDQPYGGSYSTVISAWINSINTNKPLRFNGTGTDTRDYIHVQDILSANIFCAEYGFPFKGEILDVGCGKSYSLKDIQNIVKDIHPTCEWDYRPPRAGDVPATKANITNLSNLGWTSSVNALKGIENCFKNICIKST